MDRLGELLQQVASGELDVAQALARLSGIEDLGYARIDGFRERRCGFPEVIYGAGKTDDQLLGITRHFDESGRNLLITRILEGAAALILSEFPDADHDPLGRTLRRGDFTGRDLRGRVAVVCAGTSDLPVARECEASLEFFGYHPRSIVDVGVAGLHRLLSQRDALADSDVVIVIAGMEGALPSVVGGLLALPVIAVPTSAGYGASFGGVAALLGMLNSCASGVTVTNIDNGFGAACAAHRILRSIMGARE